VPKEEMKKYIKLLIIPLLIVVLTGCKININVNHDDINNSSILAVGDPYKIELYPEGSSEDVVTITEQRTVDEISSYFHLDNMSINKNNKVSDYKLLYKVTIYGSNARETINIVEDDNKETFFMHGRVKVRFDRKYVDALDEFVSNKDDVNNRFVLKNIDLNDIREASIDSLGQFNPSVKYRDRENIEKLYEIFSNKYSNVESTEQNPINPDALFVVNFRDYYGKTKMFYIYSKDNNYYIEDSGYAIFESNEKEFEVIKNMSKEKIS
jgi:hypothetical protein